MRRPDARKGATRCLVMGLLALAGCGRGDATSDAATRRSSSAALESGTDLVVTELRGPASVWPGQGFTVTVKACNQGTVPSNSWPRVELFLSTDAELMMPAPSNPPGTPSDQELIGGVELSTLSPGQCETRSVEAYAHLPSAAQGDGAYYLAAAIDTTHVVQELREDNNIHVSGLMGVGNRADLVVTGVKAPASVRNGYGFTATVEVCNQGTTQSQGGSYYPYYDRSRVELFLSMDAELTLPEPGSPSPSIPMDQVSVGYVEVDTLGPGQCMKRNVYASNALPPAAQGDGAYYLVAAVDTNRLEPELREDNNIHVSGLMGVGDRPDLVVTEVSGPTSVWSGQSFLASVKVCNQGSTPTNGGYSSGAQLELFLLEDATLPMPAPGQPVDPMPIGSMNLDQPLYPGQCTKKQVPAYASLPPGSEPDGAYYLAAAVDTTHAEQELREDNNVHVGGLMGVGDRPDLVVTEVSGPASVWPGQSFLASVKVCNQGTGPAYSYYPGPRLELFLSMDTELTLPDPYMPSNQPMDQMTIGETHLDQPLYPGQCVTKSVPAYAHLPPASQGDGAYYLVAAIDTAQMEQELREDNNVHVSGLMGVGHRSDLVVTEVSTPASVEHGQGFTASVKVCNQGTAPTSGGYYPYYSMPRLELFLSTDTEVSLPDPSLPYPGPPEDQMSLGYVELYETLHPAQCVTKSMYAGADVPPASQGSDTAYYLAAAIDSQRIEQELREDNNVHVMGLMGVGHRSDLVVTEVKAPASLRHGQDFTASVKVCNQGTTPTGGGSYGSPRLELFLSMDTELTLPDPSMPYPSPPEDQMPLGYVDLYETLHPAQCVTKSMQATAGVPPEAQSPDGVYYLAAAIDTTHAEQELREDNNVHVSGLVGVGYRPDLVVTELSGPVSLGQGQGFTASVKVCNQGHSTTSGGPYSRANLELFLSMDTELTMPAPSMPMPYPPMDQVSLGYVELDPLYEGQCVTKNMQAAASLPPQAQGNGAYYLVAAVDTNHAEQELREDNNIRVGGLVGVGDRSDLVLTEVSAPASVTYGQSFVAAVRVCNQGTTPTGNNYGTPRLELFLSTDTELTMPDPYMPYPSPQTDQTSIGYVELYETLPPAQCVTKNVSASANPPPTPQDQGAYYLAAAIDTQHAEQELREDNNVRVSGLMGVGYQADLVVSEVSGPVSIGPGESFTASVKVCNQGTSSTSSSPYGTRVELILSTDTELRLPDPSMPYPGPSADQHSLGYVELSQQLHAGQCVTQSVPAYASLPPGFEPDGAYYLAAAVDTTHAEQELREDNNVHVSGLVGVGYRSDLVVTEVSGPASMWPGQNLTASVKVCNQGTGPTGSGSYYGPAVELYLSMDTELTLPDPYMPMPYPPMDQAPIGNVELNQTLNPGQCVTKSVSVSASLPPQAQGDGAYYLVAAVDPYHAEQELREDNNVHVSGLVGVGYRPDLVVSGVSAPASLEPGQSFTASVKVCNQGTGPSSSGSYYGPQVELFLSMDAELTLPDPYMPMPYPPVDQVSVGQVELSQQLEPGQCVTQNVSAYASLPPQAQGDGAYYLVAAVDSNHYEQELREDNNVHVSGLVGVGNRPDLVVSGVSAPASLGPGESFTASVKVCNQGTEPSSSSPNGTRVELFLSMDAELTLPDPYMPMPYPPVDQVSIGYVELSQQLHAGQCVTQNVPGYASLPPQAQGDGAYYLAAAVDTTHAEQELREDNNVHVSGLVGVGYQPDLVVSGVSAPASLEPGQNFTASVKVCNQGTEPSSSSPNGTRVELFLSMDAELTLPDPSMPAPGPSADQQSLGYVELSQQLYPGQCVTQSVPAYASLPPEALVDGPLYLAAMVDTNHAEQELREDNNVHVSGLVGVGYRPDLVVSEVSAPASLEHGQSFTASVKVCNQGTAPTQGYSYGSAVELFLSTDAELTPPDPSSPSTGMQGDQMPIGYVQLDQSVYPGQCVTRSISASAQLPPQAQGDGAYYLAAIVDTNHSEQELREDNNVHVSGLVGVGYRPDLVVSEVSAPASVEPGQSFTASVKVCNQGTEPSSSSPNGTRVELFLSMDTELTLPSPGQPPPPPSMMQDQQPIGDVVLDQPLQPGQCVTKSVPAYASLPPAAQGDGAYYLAAVIDINHSEQELREDNNVHVSGLVGVGYRPDLVVTEVSGPASMQGWQNHTATVKVCNQGTVDSQDTAWLLVMLSVDDQLTIPTPSSPMSNEQTTIGSIDVAPLPAGQCVTKDVSVYASPPPESQVPGVYYLGAIIDTNYWVQELREDNNTRAESTVELTL